MRISLNQKPNSSRDFGFQAAWDSTGARITSIQLGNNSKRYLKEIPLNKGICWAELYSPSDVMCVCQPNWQS